MVHCELCGINLEPDFDDENGLVCAQCRSKNNSVDCEYFEIIDWNEETHEIYHAVCTMPSPVWPNCNLCQQRVEYRDIEYGNKVLMERWLLGKHITLTTGDVDILDGSRSRHVRIDPNMDTEVKNLYDMYKLL